MAGLHARPVQIGHAQHPGRKPPLPMRAEHTVFLLAPDLPFHRCRFTRVRLRNPLRLRHAVAPA